MTLQRKADAVATQAKAQQLDAVQFDLAIQEQLGSGYRAEINGDTYLVWSFAGKWYVGRA